MSNLHGALSNHMYMLDQLRAAFPDQSDDDLADTLEGMSNLDEMIIRTIRSNEDDEALVLGLSARLDEMSERQARLKQRIATKRELVASVMERADLKKIVAPDFTLSLSKRARSVVITDEDEIPAAFKVAPEPPAPRPDKKAIKEALEGGTTVPGAHLNNGGVSLTVRKK
jgi:hypothetical protein